MGFSKLIYGIGGIFIMKEEEILKCHIDKLNHRIKINSELIEKLRIEILGKDWYIVDSVGGMQADEIIVDEIIRAYKRLELANRSIFYKIKYRIKDIVARW